jgi:hypothetical protein
MDVENLLAKASENLSVRRAFGAAYEKDGMLIIPVALVAGGGGGGTGTARSGRDDSADGPGAPPDATPPDPVPGDARPQRMTPIPVVTAERPATRRAVSRLAAHLPARGFFLRCFFLCCLRRAAVTGWSCRQSASVTWAGGIGAG